MSILRPLESEYKPTAAFSFEFFERNSKTGDLKSPSIGEVFFLLPPEEYSMTEGYKINITKTSAGGWVDDFGNDFKKIRLTGSLYSYYTGYPRVSSAGLTPGGGIKKFVKNIGNTVAREAGRLAASAFSEAFNIDIPGLKGLNGLQEFYKLRHIVSRFRDEYVLGNGDIQTPLHMNMPEVDKVIGVITGKKLFDKIGIVYHDYDDNNHYEVVFTNFMVRRSKDDPFSANYTIEMTGLKQYQSSFIGVGKPVKREVASNVIADMKTRLNAAFDTIAELANVPAKVLDFFTSLTTLNDVLEDSFEDFKSNVTASWNEYVSKVDETQAALGDFEEAMFVQTEGAVIEDLEDETADLDPQYANVQAAIDEEREVLSYIKGTEKYYQLDETEKTYNVDSISLNDNDFDSDGEAKQDNVFISRDRIYYQVKQGDTLHSISNKFYGDYNRYSVIAQANDIKGSDFENEALIGKSIVVPLAEKTASKELDNNLVYYRRLKQATPRERQLQVLGNDFSLNSNREINVDGTGDLALEYGDNCYMENINDRISFPAGTLSPIHPEWGVSLNIGQAPREIALTKLFDDIDKQLLSDPRTQLGFVDRNKADLVGDALKVDIHIKPQTGNRRVLDVSDAISGLLI